MSNAATAQAQNQQNQQQTNEAHLFFGHFMAKAVKPEIGSYNGKRKVRVEMRITTPGERLGKVLAYEGKLDADNIKYTKRAMIALGWKGQSVSTFVDDVKAADREVEIEVRIAEYTKPDTGQVRRWSSIDRIGNFAPPLQQLDADGTREMDSWFAEVGDVGATAGDGGGGSGGAGSGRVGGLPGDDEDIPFVSSDPAHDPLTRR